MLGKLERVAAFAQAQGARMLPIAANVREPGQVAALFARIAAECGTLTAVVNNAGAQFPQVAIDFSVKGLSAVVDIPGQPRGQLHDWRGDDG
jgi:citronellol/citronellal dehydrogenase